MARTDCHRPGDIVPTDYEYALSYALGAESDPGFGIKEMRALCETVGWKREGRMVGGPGKCGICGAAYRYGDVWVHVPTGHLVHVGQDCAAKYEMLADREDFLAAIESLKKGRRAAIQAKVNAEKRETFLARHPGLAEALGIGSETTPDHYILRDLAGRFRQYCELSEKQVALAFKLVTDVAKRDEEKANRVEEKHVSAPEGRIAVRGIVVSRKAHESDYGTSIKVTVKVSTPDGAWLAWGTLPSAICGIPSDPENADVGDEIEFTGTLAHGNQPHFAFFKRPTKARIIAKRETKSA